MLQKDKDGNTTFFCIRGSGGGSGLQKKMTSKDLIAVQEKTPTLTIPCMNGDHKDCGGDGCECDCKHINQSTL